MSWAKSFILFQMLFFEFHTQNIPFTLKSIPILELLHENISELRLFFMVIGIQKEPSFEIDKVFTIMLQKLLKKNNFNFDFHIFLWCIKKFYEGL